MNSGRSERIERRAVKDGREANSNPALDKAATAFVLMRSIRQKMRRTRPYHRQSHTVLDRQDRT
jgi:hypothetical protein